MTTSPSVRRSSAGPTRPRVPAALAWVGLWAVAGVLPACGPPPKPAPSHVPPAPVSHIDRIQLWLTPPTPMNWDARPGPDGLQLRVLLWCMDQNLSVLANGTIEFRLYQGNVQREQIASAQTVHSWRFTPEQMTPFRRRTMVGWGYLLRLPWGANAPRGSSVTLVASYIPPTGPAVLSDPLIVPMRLR